MSKPKLAIYWAASCGGCDVSILDIHEHILDVDKNFELCLWPVAADFKYKDVRLCRMERFSLHSSMVQSGIQRMSTLQNYCERRAKYW
ncbi:MAG: hypothetical protein ACP5KG_02035 [Myxococcota bacterium]